MWGRRDGQPHLRPPPPPPTNKTYPLRDCPHYSDPEAVKDHTIFGAETGGIGYDYSDRLWQGDYDKADAAGKIAQASGKPAHSCLYYEAYLSAYFGKDIEICHIVAGCNRSSGCPYLVFGYRDRVVGTKGSKKGTA